MSDQYRDEVWPASRIVNTPLDQLQERSHRGRTANARAATYQRFASGLCPPLVVAEYPDGRQTVLNGAGRRAALRSTWADVHELPVRVFPVTGDQHAYRIWEVSNTQSELTRSQSTLGQIAAGTRVGVDIENVVDRAGLKLAGTTSVVRGTITAASVRLLVETGAPLGLIVRVLREYPQLRTSAAARAVAYLFGKSKNETTVVKVLDAVMTLPHVQEAVSTTSGFRPTQILREAMIDTMMELK